MDTGVATEWGREPAAEIIEYLPAFLLTIGPIILYWHAVLIADQCFIFPSRYFGSRQRIGMVHFRNVVVVQALGTSVAGASSKHQEHLHYIETFVNEGDADMAACMSALVRTGYTGGVDPDHTPHLLDDDADTPLGWTLALGYIAALRDACCAGASARL